MQKKKAFKNVDISTFFGKIYEYMKYKDIS